MLEKFGKSRRLIPFISPYVPFIDPGSEAFEHPDKFGYKIFYHTVEEYRRAMESPSWKYLLSYETKWMTRQEIVDSSYEAGLALNQLKAEFDLIDPKKAQKTEIRMISARQTMNKIDTIMLIPDEVQRERQLQNLKSSIQQLSESTICEKKELEWPTQLLRMNVGWIVKNWLHIEVWHRLQSILGLDQT